MKKISLFLLCLTFCSQVKSQINSSAGQQSLKPLSKRGTSYYYDSKKLRNGYSVQVPFQQLNDESINLSFKKYENTRRVGRYSYLVPLVYLITVSSSHANSTNKQLTKSEANVGTALLWGAFFTNMGCNYFSNIHLRKGVDRYNQLLVKNNSVGFSIDVLPDNSRQLNFAYIHRIK
jgi:hypothetical protein